MEHTIAFYVIGVLAIFGGVELIRFSWPDAQTEHCGFFGGNHDCWQPAHLGVSCGALLIVLGAVSCFGGYNGWTMAEVLSTVKDIADGAM